MKVLITIEYNGKYFSGWQRQKKGVGVQEVLEDALSSLLKENITLTASGRTDAGVHAICQYAHFSINSNFNLERLPYAVNTYLPEGVRVLSASVVDESFNARLSAHKKTYLYKIYTRKILSPLREGFYANVPYELNYEQMLKAAKLFLGKHNFKGFCSEGSSVKSFEREIYSFEIEKNQDEYYFKITGNGFLYNMVRRIVAAVVEVGKGKLSLKDITLALKDYNVKHITKNMPPCGLYLLNVEY